MASIFTKPISAKTLKGEGPVIGLEIEAGSVGAVEASGDAVNAAVQPLPAEAFRDGEVVDPDSVAEALRALFSEHKLSKRVRLGIGNQRVVARTLRLPAIENPGELDSAVRFAAQEQVAMPLDQAVVEHRVVGGVAGVEGAPPQIDVMVIAARREMISATLKPLRDAGLEPVGVDLSAFGMIRALAGASGTGVNPGSEPADGATLYCSAGDVTTLAIAKGRSCLFTRVSPVGLDQTVDRLVSSTEMSHEHARMWLTHVGLESPLETIEGDAATAAQSRSALETGASSLLDELRMSLDFYGAQEGAVPAQSVVLCGHGSAIPGLAQQLEQGLALPVEVGRPQALAELDASQVARLTLPLGLAMES
ncbi:MAG TPA: type IV pilus assembly protein PilM [Solirubrobacterales bacterium]|jgi:type IV pilus assembly protein PilM